MQSLEKTINHGVIALILAFALSLSACTKATETLANNGNAEAQSKMGELYANGEGAVSVDYAKSFEWYQKSANQGYAPAQLELGFAYRRGEGVRQDTVEGAKWIRKAADQDHAFAQLMLGALYSNGYEYEGVPYDMEQSKEWFGKACDNGEQEGCDMYKLVKEQGH